MHTTCDDCVEILKHAAALLMSEPKSSRESSLLPFDSSYQLRLEDRVSSPRCHMCALLSACIPRLLEPLDPKEMLVLAISSTRHDPNAATVSLVGCDVETLNRQQHFSGSLRIQEGEREARTYQNT